MYHASQRTGNRQVTRLATLLTERNRTYTAVAAQAHLQPRTVRQIATGETPIDNVSVGTVRRLASALGVPPATLIEVGAPRPGDPSVSRGARLSAAVRDVMWAGQHAIYASPVESHEADALASASPEEFFADMPVIDAGRG